MPHATGGKSNRYSYWKWVQYYDTQRAWAFTWLSKVFLEIRGATKGGFYFYPKNYVLENNPLFMFVLNLPKNVSYFL